MVFGLGYQSMVFHFEIYNNGFDLSYITNGHFTYFVSQGLTLGSVRASPEINILISGNLKRHSTRLQALVFGKKYPLPPPHRRFHIAAPPKNFGKKDALEQGLFRTFSKSGLASLVFWQFEF